MPANTTEFGEVSLSDGNYSTLIVGNYSDYWGWSRNSSNSTDNEVENGGGNN